MVEANASPGPFEPPGLRVIYALDPFAAGGSLAFLTVGVTFPHPVVGMSGQLLLLATMVAVLTTFWFRYRSSRPHPSSLLARVLVAYGVILGILIVARCRLDPLQLGATELILGAVSIAGLVGGIFISRLTRACHG